MEIGDALVINGVVAVGILSGIPLLVSMICGLFVNVLQAATQIQDPVITFVTKFIAVSVVMFLGAPWFADVILEYFTSSLNSIANVSR